VADALKLGLHVGRTRHIAVGELAEVEFHAGLQAPVQRQLVDGDGALAVIHGGGEMIRRVEMGGAMGG
jgi:hypothetical protein